MKQMSNHYKLFNKAVEAINCKLNTVSPDGFCLFHAIYKWAEITGFSRITQFKSAAFIVHYILNNLSDSMISFTTDENIREIFKLAGLTPENIQRELSNSWQEEIVEDIGRYLEEIFKIYIIQYEFSKKSKELQEL
jgi:hypothetical protein